MANLHRSLLYVLLSLLPILVAAQPPPALEAVEVTGLVLDPDGKPVADALVTGWDMNTRQAVEVRSDQAGRFTIEAATGMFLAYKAGYAAGAALTLQKEITITLGADPVELHGKVQTPEGEPIANSLVSVGGIVLSANPQDLASVMPMFGVGKILQASTGPDGKFTIPGVPRKLRVALSAVAEGRAHESVSLPEGADEVLITLPAEATISGRVLHGDKPMPDVMVIAVPATVDWSAPDVTNLVGLGLWDQTMETSGPDGAYTVRHLKPGTYAPSAMLAPNELVMKPRSDVTVKAGEHVTGVDLYAISGGVVRVSPVDATTGALVEQGVSITITMLEPRKQSEPTDVLSGGDFLTRLPPGKYLVEVTSGPHHGATQPVTVEVKEGSTQEIKVPLKPLPPVLVLVQTPEGKPAAEATVGLIGDVFPDNLGEPIARGPLWRQVLTGPDGRVKVPSPRAEPVAPPPGFPPDTPAIFVWDKTGKLAGFALIPPQAANLTVKLQPACFMEVSVVDQDGKPLPGIMLDAGIQIGDSIHYITEATSDAEGHVTLGPLPAKQPLAFSVDYKLEGLVMSEGWDRPETVTLAPGERRKYPLLQISTIGRSLKVFVGDQDQKPVRNALVVCGEADPVRTDEQGRAELRQLPLKGKVTVIAVHPSLPLFAGQTTDPDWQQWPGLLLAPLGRATGVIHDKQGQPMGKVQLQSMRAPMPVTSILLQQRLPQEPWGPPEELTADENGRWQAQGLIAGVSYPVIIQGKDVWWGQAGEFVATGGEALQDVGVMVFDPEVEP